MTQVSQGKQQRRRIVVEANATQPASSKKTPSQTGNPLAAGQEPKYDKQVLEKKVRQFKEIKDHPKLRNQGQLLDPEGEQAVSSKKVKKLKNSPRKKFSRRGQYEDDDDLVSEEDDKSMDKEKKVPLTRLQKIDRMIEGQMPVPKKEPNIAAENARVMRDRQSLLERMRPSELDDKVYKSVL